MAAWKVLNWADSRGEHFRREVSDVRRDLVAREELSHLVAEGIAVVLKQVVAVATVHREEREAMK